MARWNIILVPKSPEQGLEMSKFLHDGLQVAAPGLPESTVALVSQRLKLATDQGTRNRVRARYHPVTKKAPEREVPRKLALQILRSYRANH